MSLDEYQSKRIAKHLTEQGYVCQRRWLGFDEAFEVVIEGVKK